MAKEKTTVKLCKYCKTTIPVDAKICPNCKKKQGGIVKWIILAIIVIIIIAAVAGGEEDEPKKVENDSTPAQSDAVDTSKEETDSKEENAETPDFFKVGETAELSDIQVTFVSATESTGNDFMQPESGKVFLICEFDISNNSSEEIVISSLMNFEAYCDDYATDISFNAEVSQSDKSTLDETIAAGKKMAGIIGYEVPADWQELEVNFTPDFWSGNAIKFIATK